MPPPRTLAFLQKLRGTEPSPVQRAKYLIAAIDAGGLPLIPAFVNDIVRQLGLEVSLDAPMAASTWPERITAITLPWVSILDVSDLGFPPTATTELAYQARPASECAQLK